MGLLLWLAALVLALCAWVWNRRARSAAPGPWPLPLLGNVLYFRNLPVVFQHFRDLHRDYGDVFRIYLGPKLITVVTRPEDAQRLLVGVKARVRDPYTMSPLLPFMGQGLVTGAGEKWKTHRRLIEPTFHAEILSKFTHAFNDGAQFLCARLAERAGRQTDVNELLILISLRTVSYSMFGTSLDEVEPDIDQQFVFAAELNASLKISQKRIFFPWLHWEWVLMLTADGPNFQKQVNMLSDMVRKGISLKRQSRGESLGTKRKAFLDILMSAEGELLMSEDEIFDEVRTFALAGSDSTATTLGYALSLLALHPEWQDRAQHELDQLFGAGGGGDYFRDVTEADLAQLPVVDAIVKETLRLYPAAPNAPVVSPEEDVPLEGGRVVVPAGSCAFVSLALLHRRPDVFPDPERFDPRRFLDGGAEALPPYSYVPFGAGSRKCIGFRFAAMQMKTVLAAVLRRFRLLPGSSRAELDNFEISITGKPVTGYRITCVPRERQTPTSQ